MKSKIKPSKMAAGPRKTPGRAPLRAVKPAPVAAEPEWLLIAKEWAKEYRRTSGRDAKIVGFTEGRINVFTTRDVSYALGELRGMTLVLKRRESAQPQPLVHA